jgi:membrane dipeptidase
MNRLGMMVDISHVADKTFYDALAVSQAPMIASHSSCRALNGHARNMSDDMIKALAARGGVIHINYHIGFLGEDFRTAYSKMADEYRAQSRELDKQYANDPKALLAAQENLQKEYRAKWPRVTREHILEHIDHAVKLVGADHVGLGSDFDGAWMPEGMDDASYLPQLTQALLDRGYSEADIQKILGGNTLRVMAEVERVAQRLSKTDSRAKSAALVTSQPPR